MQVWW
jgi:Subtilisin-like serine proteases